MCVCVCVHVFVQASVLLIDFNCDSVIFISPLSCCWLNYVHLVNMLVLLFVKSEKIVVGKMI